ncbi:isopentenyl-diphosphate Delta-isomerase [Fusibacter sp. JL216-2]|uniref:isopentenyl-diphosphate Delta-isomerase n=1 Tax=Fusibacter sp. JL216-2 TaxID=3071453 RepID=UPI003D33F0BE
MEYVILVDENDKATGQMEKMEAHHKGVLHRAFSVFLHDGNGNVLLQRRALSKYHSGGLWTNACCSHPRQGESVEKAAHRRLMEELGVDCPVKEVSTFLYRAELDKGMIEHEFDHVLTGVIDPDDFPFNPEEVDSVDWMAFDNLVEDIEKNPSKYTVWFQIIMKNVNREMLMI